MHSLACSQKKGLSEYQRRASWLCIGPFPTPCPKQVSNSQSWKTRGCCNLDLRPASYTKLWAGSQLLTTSSWDTGRLTSAGKFTAWDQLPTGDIAHLRWCSRAVPGKQSTRDQRGDEEAWPTWDSALAKHLVTWAARTWEGHKTHAQPSLCSFRLPKNLSGLDLGSAPWRLGSVDPGSTHHLELGQTQCGPYTASIPQTYQRYFFAVSLPPHKTTEQVSLNKWPPSPPWVRVENRHWRHLKKEEAKMKKRELFWKWQAQQIKTL